MCQFSERQSVIQELFTLLLLQHEDDTDDLISKLFNLPGSPTIGNIFFSDNPEMMLVTDELFSNEDDMGDLLQTVISTIHSDNQRGFRVASKPNLSPPSIPQQQLSSAASDTTPACNLPGTTRIQWQRGLSWPMCSKFECGPL
ncbi:hypothetical protein PGT21_023706 [Puccinia graminis f. sp. tritici]|uniref:Uncharacterized protein n=1 Tax=Puccinia graminis f. sp. tritici TaxID=56615 RepID=A0A5B0PL56_PUCGR|nr:hypothetical protein PGT21_023706 [Puccinia graminis f. sp. tritici]